MQDANSTMPQTLGDVARIQAKQRGDQIAFTFEGRATTFAEFDRNTNQVANGLIAAGIEPGMRISYIGKNSDYYFELLIGAAKAGVVMTPVNWRLAPPEIVYILTDCRAQILFVGGEFTGLVRGIAAELPTVKKYIAMEGGMPEWASYEGWRNAQSGKDPGMAVGRDDVAL